MSRYGCWVIEEVVNILEECIDKIDELLRRIELAPKWRRAQLYWIHRELEELRALVVKARTKA